MNDSELARLFEAMRGDGRPVPPKTRKNALRRILLTEDGLTLVKSFSACLRPAYGPVEGYTLAYQEGRRSILWEIIRAATEEEPQNELQL